MIKDTKWVLNFISCLLLILILLVRNHPQIVITSKLEILFWSTLKSIFECDRIQFRYLKRQIHCEICNILSSSNFVEENVSCFWRETFYNIHSYISKTFYY